MTCPWAAVKTLSFLGGPRIMSAMDDPPVLPGTPLPVEGGWSVRCSSLRRSASTVVNRSRASCLSR